MSCRLVKDRISAPRFRGDKFHGHDKLRGYDRSGADRT